MCRGDLQNFYNNAAERSIASFNTPHSLVISYVYELPFGPGKRVCEPHGRCRQDRWRVANQWQHALPERHAFADYRRKQQRIDGRNRATELERHEPHDQRSGSRERGPRALL